MLGKEMYQLYQNISPLTYSEVFHRRGINYNLPINSEFALPNVRSAFHGSESISYFKPKNCSHRLCNTFSIYDSLQLLHAPFKHFYFVLKIYRI